MSFDARPDATGLYDPRFEHDACGVGFLANIKGRKSHDIVSKGIRILCNLSHRGAAGADPLDGDGAGILIQLPDGLYRAISGFDLPMAGDYGTGIVFLPTDPANREKCMRALEGAVADYDMQLIGWRDVPTDNQWLGKSAKRNEPIIKQVFVGRGTVAPKQFETTLFLARKRTENVIAQNNWSPLKYFYICSLSSRVVVVGSSRVDLQACKLEYSIVSPK